MRPILTKYAGECRKCAATIPAGVQAVYEKRVGVYCVGCAPSDPEEIRAVRQEAAERKASKLDEWAEKREQKAAAVLNVSEDHYSRDWAFITQPGHIPARARWIEKTDRELESLQKAREMRTRADNLRNVRVAGDKERKREAERAAVRLWIKKGQKVSSALYGVGVVMRVNQKTATVQNTHCNGYTCPLDLSWLTLVEDVASAVS